MSGDSAGGHDDLARSIGRIAAHAAASVEAQAVIDVFVVSTVAGVSRISGSTPAFSTGSVSRSRHTHLATIRAAASGLGIAGTLPSVGRRAGTDRG
ncbi:hypothetical protein GCM10022251_77610 [Phytohabitans flavus]|uniref:Uncharacterized protein n=1 Tax=Phytohabitans flavus TaxID=1076124 RepID=A0A6F8XIL7_9ACTN|nr:hypothetical protein Pflav_000570 [Phytohabitans flavus]